MSDLEFDTEAAAFYKEFEDKVNQVFGYEENAEDAYYEQNDCLVSEVEA